MKFYKILDWDEIIDYGFLDSAIFCEILYRPKNVYLSLEYERNIDQNQPSFYRYYNKTHRFPPS